MSIFKMNIPAFSGLRFGCLRSPAARFLIVASVGLHVRSASAQMFDDLDTSGFFARAGGVARFNVKAGFSGIAPAKPPSGVYENGFVLPDIGGSATKTWNWGYNSANQIVSDQLVLNRLDGAPVYPSQDIHVSDPLLGAEVIGGYRFSAFEIGKFPARFGVEAGYGYSEFSGDVSSAASHNATRATDSFGLHGVIPPTAPFAGTSEGPGPLIDLQPSHTEVSSLASSQLGGSLQTALHEFRFGPFFEVDLHPRVTLGVGVGYASVFTDSTFDYHETITGLPQLPSTQTTTSLARSTWHTGAYAEGRVTYRITELLGVFLAGDIKSYNNHVFGDSSHQLTVNLGTTYAAKAGLNFQF
jgi:hypothetical protein